MSDKTNGAPDRLLLFLTGLAASVVMLPSFSTVPLYYLVERANISQAVCAAIGAVLAVQWGREGRPVRFVAGPALLSLFALSAAVTLFRSHDIFVGLQRVQLIACWLIVALAGFRLFRSRENFLGFARWAACIVIYVGVVGVLEKYSVISPMMSDIRTSQVASTLGYPTLYAGWLLAVWFLIRGALAAAGNLGDKSVFILALALAAANLFFCQSYAAWVCIAASEAFLLVRRAAILTKANTRRRVAPAAAAALLLLFLLTAAYVHHPKDFTRSFSIKHKSVAARLITWRVMWDMFRDRPVAGFGAGQIEIYGPKYFMRAGYENNRWFNHPKIHYPPSDNFLFLALVEQGIPGFLALLGVFAAAIAVAARSGRVSEWKRGPLAVQGAGVVALIVFQTFHFPFLTPGVWIIVWANIAVIWAFGSPDDEIKENISRPKPSMWRYMSAVILCVAMAYMAWFSIGAQMQDSNMYKGFENAVSGGPSAIADTRRMFEQRLPLIPRTWRYHYYKGEALLASGKADEARKELDIAIRLRPHNLVLQTQRIQYNAIIRKQTNIAKPAN